MDTLLMDVRHAMRRLLRNKLFSSVIILCLALGVGANSAIFCVVNALMLRPLPPIQDVDRVAFALEMRTDDDPFEATLTSASAFQNEGHAFESMGLGRYNTFRLLGRERPELVSGADVSASYLPTLGVEPILGRTFTPDDDRPGAEPVVLISHSLWVSHFGSDPGVLGAGVNLENTVYTVVGVLPERFDLPLATKLWVPLRMDIEALSLRERFDRSYFLVARLRQGVSFEQANGEARSIAQRIEQAHPEFFKGWSIKLIPLRRQLMGDITGSIGPTILLLMGIVGFLLLIACVNVANLFLARALERSHETAVQVSLGASRGRLISQLLAESILLSLAGGAVGLLFARFVTASLMSLNPVSFNALKDVFENIQLDGTVLGFTFLVSLATGFAFALAPVARTAFRGSLVDQLKEGGQRTGEGAGGRRLFDILMVAEIAVATLLLIGAGLMIRSFQRLSKANLGYRPENLMAVELPLLESDYPNHERRVQFVDRLLEKVRNLPGVSAAGTTTNIPLAVASWDSFYTIEGKPVDSAETPVCSHRMVSAGYLEMIGVSLIKGRLIGEQDRAGNLPAVVVSKEFANRTWPGEDAIGKRLKKGHPPAPNAVWYTVVGVIDDVKEDRFNFRIDRPVWYLPYGQAPNDIPVWLLVRSSAGPASLMPSIREQVASINRYQPISETVLMEDYINEFMGPPRFTATLSTLFAAFGLVLAAVGVYGVTAYSVIQRTREFAVRIALGARWANLLRMVLGRGLRLVLAGAVIGSAAGLILGRVLSSMLYQVEAATPETFLAPVGILLFASLSATCVPLIRLARLDPVEGLRVA